MSIATLFKPKPDAASERPAAAALSALKKRIAALAAEDADFAGRETSAGHDLRRHDDAQHVLQQLEERHLAALADIEVKGTSGDDPAALEQHVSEQRAHVAALATRRRLAEAVLVRVRTERQRIRAETLACHQQLPAAVHAGVREHLSALAPAFVEAEKTYLSLLAQVFGAARLADRIAKAHLQSGGAHFGWTGGMNVTDIYTPRPSGAEFQPVPQRDAIERDIQAQAAALEKSL